MEKQVVETVDKDLVNIIVEELTSAFGKFNELEVQPSQNKLSDGRTIFAGSRVPMITMVQMKAFTNGIVIGIDRGKHIVELRRVAKVKDVKGERNNGNNI